MPDSFDRLEGALSSQAVKKPVRVAVSTNITLSGLQTLDGVTLAEDDRALVYGQTDATTNGIYAASTGVWTRTKDFDGTGDWVEGTLIPIAEGTVGAGKIFRVISDSPEDVGESDIVFESISFFDAHENDSVIAAATIDLSAAEADAVDITGSGATITAITVPAGYTRIVRFDGANTLTHSATLVLPGALNITTAAGDFAILRGYTSAITRVAAYQRGDSHPLIAGQATIASAATVDLGSVREQSVTISGVTPITSFGSSAPTGVAKFCRLSGAILLTHGASLICPESQNLQGADGDCFIARHEGSGVWRVINFTRAASNVANTATTPNAATSESDLITYSLPAGRLASSGAYCRVSAWGTITTASTAVARRARMYFGATVIADTGAINLPGGSWVMEALVARTSAAGAQQAVGRVAYSTGAAGVAGSSEGVLISAPAETLSAAITIKVTGLATGATGQMAANALVVEPFPR